MQALLPAADSAWRDLAVAAIDPDDDCDDDTALFSWLEAQLADVLPDTLAVLFQFGVIDWPFAWVVGGDQDASDDVIGTEGQHTRELSRRHRDYQRFWDVATDDVLLQGMSGAVIADDAKMVPVLSFLIGVDPAVAQGLVDLVQATIEADPAIDYDHPIFTFNAFAWSGDVPGIGPIPDKIVMGEGLLEGYDAIGLGDVAPDLIHAHEFAHHVQFELGLLDDAGEPSAEATRRTELMADAMAGYQAAHVRASTFRNKRLAESVATISNVGDCAFDDPTHHGTPRERAIATEWGIDLAVGAGPVAAVVPATAFVESFDAALPDIVAN